MIFSKVLYNSYFQNYKKKSIYSVFSNIYGFGKSIKNIKIFIRCFGINIFKINKKIFNISKMQESINIFLLTNYFSKSYAMLFKKLVNFYKKNKIIYGSYRYIKYYNGLPINGQRSHTNARTTQYLSGKSLKTKKRYNINK